MARPGDWGIPADFDPTDLIEQVIESDWDPTVFSEIKDDSPTAPNVAVFLTDHEYLGIRPYSRQMQLAINLYNDFCWDCSDVAIATNPPVDLPLEEMLDRIQLLDFGVCPKCGKTRLDFLNRGVTTDYWEADACLGQRSGKSAIVAALSNYSLHRYLKIPSPSQYFGLWENSSVLYMNFVAVTKGQAEENLWRPFKGLFDNSPWFREYNRQLSEAEQRTGQKIFIDNQTYFLYKHKGLTGYATGPDKRVLRGRTRFLYAIDEVGWFNHEAGQKSIKVNADEIDAALRNSMETVRGACSALRSKGHVDIPMAMSFLISSPQSANDKIMRLVREAEYDPTKYAEHRPTWECNPNLPHSYFAPKFKSQPMVTRRDIEAIPPLSESPFIEDWRTIVRNERRDWDQDQWITVETKQNTDEFDTITQYLDISVPIPDKSIPRILSVDAGFNHNAFAMVIMHLEEPTAAGEEPIGVVDASIECRPGPNHIPVNFPMMYEKAILPLTKSLRIELVTFDRWNSIDLSQRLNNNKVKAIQFSPRLEHFLDYQTKLLTGQFRFPRLEVTMEEVLQFQQEYESFVADKPVAHLAMQILTVQRINKQVIKGQGMDDDMFRAMVLANRFLFLTEYRKTFSNHFRPTLGPRPAVGVSAPRVAGLGSSIGSLTSRSLGGGDPTQQVTRVNRLQQAPKKVKLSRFKGGLVVARKV